MYILGIESSCDETAASIIDENGNVLSNEIHSQIATHAPYGGVVPEIASREHLKAIEFICDQALQVAGISIDDVELIAATNGPGLSGALMVGFQFAKTLAWVNQKKLVAVNHLHGHLMAASLRFDEEHLAPTYPHIALLASGGHTAIYLVHDECEFEQLGQTRDDAAGECFDKVAKILGLGYPGGPIIDKLAKTGNEDAIPFSPPMPAAKNPNFSFSGIKTAVARYVEKSPPQDDAELADLCASFQKVATRIMARKAVEACKIHHAPQLVLSGGVAANSALRRFAKTFCEKENVALFVPSLRACTDNAAMIALAGLHTFRKYGQVGLECGVYSRDPLRQRGKYRRDGSFVESK